MPLFAKSAIDSQAVESAIAMLENRTSAELRVVIEKNAKFSDVLAHESPVVARAEQVFNELGMQQTAAHNGVLIYVVLNQRQCAVIGDYGIDRFVQADFWQQCCDVISQHASVDALTQGISQAIAMIGDKLAVHFPYQDGDVNELPNEVVIR
ncbi:TPM domain-containing protein [Pasteurellaceae bacterium HPA106]|uniref:TPM domain-containing protein n=1 Tax=Spirabiliibacterium pneumoniae TaxID=221400 RepID=UPI001AAD37B9|nr:TPM domain-containing protein [Spirabiliibacterium pneumoniae]MBE2896472.1 TPM domain-containing protein [Spirabiliibacterium pneumoniae]